MLWWYTFYSGILVFLRILELEAISVLELADLALPAKSVPVQCASVYASNKQIPSERGEAPLPHLWKP